MSSVRVSNYSDAYLDRLDAALPGAVREACEHIAGTARPFVPVRTGHLRDSNVVEVQKERRRAVGQIAYTADYAAAVEFGTRYMAARAYLRQGFENGAPGAARIIAETLSQETKG